nr:MAG TPA: hypothetical protein [Bacteriophage sp.]
MFLILSLNLLYIYLYFLTWVNLYPSEYIIYLFHHRLTDNLHP